MMEKLKMEAERIIEILMTLPHVKNCTLYGSVAEGRADAMSDIDIEVDVSGFDNGQFMLSFPGLLSGNLRVIYSDFAPSLIPDKYIVSLAIDENNPFMMLDVSCAAKPHITTVTRQQAAEKNSLVPHTLKVWVANLKHYLRGVECRGDILRMANRLGIEHTDMKSNYEILGEVLSWLEMNADDKLAHYLYSCKQIWIDVKHDVN